MWQQLKAWLGAPIEKFQGTRRSTLGSVFLVSVFESDNAYLREHLGVFYCFEDALEVAERARGAKCFLEVRQFEAGTEDYGSHMRTVFRGER